MISNMKQQLSSAAVANVNIEMDPSRMLKLRHMYSGLPVFATESLRNSKNSSVRFFPGGWLAIVAGNELFLWKYISAPLIQSRSTCLRFNMPASDLPHTARLVCLIFPTNGMESASTSLPTGCLALSPCGQNLRLWPQLTRNYVHTDLTPSALINGLYGDEAIQMESTSLAGVFLLATRTAHLMLIDARNVQSGLNCRILANRAPSVSSGENASLLSGLSRRMSNLFSIVASSGGLNSRLLPTRNENTVFVRLITQPQASTEACSIYMLMEHQLDIWWLEENLEERFQGSHAIESLVTANECGTGMWRAVDMAIRCGSKASSDSSILYLLVKSSSDSHPPCLISLIMNGTQLHVVQNIHTSTVKIEWPFALTNNDSLLQTICWELSVPALSEWERTGRGAPTYPCLLASVCRPSLGQVSLIEVLTGKLVAKFDFGQQVITESGTVSALLTCGGFESQNLFVYVTGQRGLFALVPTDEASDTSVLVDHEKNIESPIGTPKKHRTATSQDPTHSDASISSQDRGPLILVYTRSQTRLVTVRLAPDRIVVSDASTNDRPTVKLSAPDLAFVTLCEAARIYWMGFEEQARHYLTQLTSQSNLCAALPTQFLRLAKRVLNERPRSDARWRHACPNRISGSADSHGTLTPEGCLGFHLVTSSRCTEPILPQSRFEAKTDALNRLADLWKAAVSTAPVHCDLNTVVPLTEVCSILGYRLSVSQRDVDLDQGTSQNDTFQSQVRRSLAGEMQVQEAQRQQPIGDRSSDDSLSEVAKTALNYFACIIADDSNAIESCAASLAARSDPALMIRAAEDCPLDGVGQCANVHILSGLHLAGELVEFTRGMHAKLARDPEPNLQPVFRSVAIEAGFSTSCLQIVGPQEAILQTITLIPNFVAAMGDAVNLALENSADAGSEAESSSSPSQEAVNFLLLCSSVISAGFVELMRYRSRQLQLLETTLTQLASPSILTKSTHYLACWLTDVRPFGIGDVLLQLLEHLVRLGSGEMRPESPESTYVDSTQLAKDAAVKAVEWVEFILTVAQQRVRWATTYAAWAWSRYPSTADQETPHMDTKQRLESVQRVRRLRFWYATLRKRLICLIADQLDRPEIALTLAERFADCGEMVRLCYLLEVQDELAAQQDPAHWSASDQVHPTLFHHRRLSELLKRVPSSYGLADHALQWYFDCGEHARVQSLLTLLEKIQSKVERQRPAYGSSTDAVPHSDVKPTLTTVPKDARSLKRAGPTLPSSADALNRFLLRGDTRDHAWPHMLATRQYAKAADILLEEGCKEMRFLGRRKLLLSLAKLAYLTSDTEDHVNSPLGLERRESMLAIIELLLECVQMQECLPDSLRREIPELCSSSQTNRNDPVLDLVTLARLYVSGVPGLTGATKQKRVGEMLGQSGLSEFRRAIRLADLIPDVNRFYPNLASLDPVETRTNLMLHIWCQAFKMDDWTHANEGEDPIQVCGRSFACKLVHDVRKHYDNAMELLPTPDELCGCAELEDLSDDPQFTYLLQAGFEYILRHSNDVPN